MKRLPKPIRYGLIAMVMLTAVSAAIYAARRAWPTATSEVLPITHPVQAGDFTLNIAADGELQSAESVAIAVPFVPVQRLRIASVVPDGHHVNKGEMLVEFDPAELDLEMLDHQSSLEAANQKLSM